MRGRCLAVHDDRQSGLGSGLGDRFDELSGDEHDASRAVGDAVTQRVWPEELAQRQRDGAGLGDRDLLGRRGEALRHEQPDALAASDPIPTSAFASRFDALASSAKVLTRWAPPTPYSITAGSSATCSSEQATPMLKPSGIRQRNGPAQAASLRAATLEE